MGEGEGICKWAWCQGEEFLAGLCEGHYVESLKGWVKPARILSPNIMECVEKECTRRATKENRCTEHQEEG